MRRILCATDFSARSQRAIRRAGLLARQGDAELTLLQIVDDDHPPRLAELERREAGKFLDEQRQSIAELRGGRCRATSPRRRRSTASLVRTRRSRSY